MTSQDQEPVASPPQRQSRWRRISVGCLMALALVCGLSLLIVRIERTAGTITITEVILTTGFDAQGQPLAQANQFSPEQPRIYCVVKVSAPKPVNVGVRWFYSNEIIADEVVIVDGQHAWHIQPPAGQVFQEGVYRVEVYLVKEPVRTVYFSVGKAD